MSAINAVRFSDCAVIVTDGAAYDRQGIVRSIGPKCHTLDRLNVAVTTTGAQIGGKMLREIAAKWFAGIDDIAENGRSLLTRWYATYDMALDAEAQHDFMALFCGWSDKLDRPRMVVFKATAAAIEFGEPLQLEMPLVGKPMLTADLILQPRAIIDMMERQRWYLAEDEVSDGHRQSVVGGHIMVTTVLREGIKHTILKTWPDRIGEKIQPPASAPNVVTLNRAERRRQAKVQRRAA